MNDDDGESPKQLVGPSVIETVRDNRPCWYVGRGRGRKPDLEDFTHALPFIGDCGALVFSEPRRSRVAVRKAVDWHRRNLKIPVTGFGFITKLVVEEGTEYRELFVEPATIWIPPEAKPAESKFWAEYALLTIELHQERGERRVHLLHIGISGLAAALYFFEPHSIEPSRIIGTPF